MTLLPLLSSRSLSRGRRASAVCCCVPCPAAAAVGRYLLPAGPTAANPLQRHAAAGWDRQTDSRTDGRPILLRVILESVMYSGEIFWRNI